QFGTGLPNAEVDDLELATGLNILAAGTHGRGMWEISTAPAAGGASIAGQAFWDFNFNSSFDGGEGTVNGATVYVDYNNNGLPDGSEPSAVTTGAGNFSMSGVNIGNWTVRETAPSGFVSTNTPAVSVATSADALTGI